MEFPFHFLRTNSVVTSRFDQLAKVLKGVDVDALRQIPDPEMEAFARDLSRGLGQDFAPTRLITASVNGLDAHSLNFVSFLCLQHRVSAFIGESDLYIDASGVYGATAEISAVTNSIATVWCQVSEHTLDRAFEDALRAPSDMDTWVQVHNFGESTAEFGVRMRMHLLDDGRFTIVWTVREDDSDLRTLSVATYEEARAVLLAFADHCPILSEYEWTNVDFVPCLSTCDLVQRSQYRLRRFGAIRDLPAGVMVRLHDRLNFSLEFGRDRDGQWRATMRHALNGGMTRTFDTAGELLEIAEAYVNNELGALLEYFPESSEMALPAALTVTAMVLPERAARWANSSIREMHRVRDAHNGAEAGAMAAFIAQVNQQAPHTLALERSSVEARALSTISVSRRGSLRTLDRLGNLAHRYGVSLVLDGAHVMVNPSGATAGGDVRCTLELFDGDRCVNRWVSVSPAALMEALMVYFSHWQLRLTVESLERPDQRLVLLAIPQDADHGSFLLKAFGPGWSMRAVAGLSQYEVAVVFVNAAESPHEIVDSVHWESVRTADLALPRRPYMLGSNSGDSTTLYSDEALATYQEAFAAAGVGDWIGVTDNRSPEDYCRVFRHDAHDWYRVEWGYNNGAVERGHVLTRDINRAYEVFRMYVEDNRELMRALDWIVGDEGAPGGRRYGAPVRLYVSRPSTGVLAHHQRYVQELYLQDPDQFEVPDPSMEGLAGALAHLLGHDVKAQRVLTIDAQMDDPQVFNRVVDLAFQHHALVFQADSGLLVNGSGAEMHEVGFAGLRNNIGTLWHQVCERTLDVAFEDALRVPDPIGAWVEVYAEGPEAMAARLDADGSWTLRWRHVNGEDSGEYRFLTRRVAGYAQARELLLAFADRSPLLDRLGWGEAAPADAHFASSAGERSELPLRRLDAVLHLPEGTLVRLHDGPGGALEYGRAGNGRWVATLETAPFSTVTREFSSGADLVAFVHMYLAADDAQAEVLFGQDAPVRTRSLWDNELTEISAMILPQRAQAWTDASVRHFHRMHADTAEDAPAELKAFFSELQQAQPAPGAIRGRAGNEVGLRAMTRAWVPKAALDGVLADIVRLAPQYGVSVVLNEAHVFYNATGGEETPFSGLTLGANNTIVQFWVDATVPAFAQGLQQLRRADELVVASSITLDSGRAEPDLQYYWLTIREAPGGYSATYEIPGGIVYSVERLAEPDVLHLYATMAQSPAAVVEAAQWHSATRAPDAPSRFQIQSNLFEPVPLDPENLDALRRVELPTKGDFIQVMDSAVEGDYVLVINDSGALRSRFVVGWGHDFGQIENFQRKTSSLAEALALAEHYVAGDRQAFVALGWKRRKVR
ncbi:hypothetical protein CKJ84_03060 [Corynebacterium sp. NML 120412]|uniref:hypothetical protein n=1 Tax=Corynebacterium sp. NML 120412 TaxID=2029401 RepID=UPI000BAA6872|nr:hypothetical protein [Corynebacterium sp. NML 120412]PAT15281.1 hypothetical protein CKJ84_03060 [Corynebacterium sp. NML 120412]